MVSSPRMPRTRSLFFAFIILCTTLACRAATRLIIPDTPTPPAPTTAPQSGCPDEQAAILEAASAYDGGSTAFPGMDTADDAITLVTYAVSGDSLGDPQLETISDKLKPYQEDLG